MCPECGTPTHDGELRRKSEQAAVVAHAVAAAEADDDVQSVDADGGADDEADDGAEGESSEWAGLAPSETMARA